MSPLNDKQLHQIRDERKEQLMTAARKVFSRRGIIGTKISMIAEEAKVSQGLFYHYFKSKDALFVELVKEGLEVSLSSVDSLHQLPGSPLSKIKYLTEMILEEDNAPGFLLIHQARISDGVPKEAKELIDQYSVTAFIDRLLPIFSEGQQIGEISEGDPVELVSSYLSVISGVMILNTHETDGYLIPKVDLLLKMITG